MKVILKYSFLIVAITFSTMVKGQYEKKKYLEKSFDVASTTGLNIQNRFGKIEINSWTKNQFSVKVEIIAKGRSEERAQRILDEIAIDIKKTTSEILFELDLEDNKKSNNGNGFEVNYTVYMPEQNLLSIKNSFGDVTMGNRRGDLNLSVAYGHMKVGDVAGNANIKLSFGSGDIGNIKKGIASIKYSDISIENANDLALKQGFSNIEIETIMDLSLDSKYGKVEIEKAQDIQADIHFSKFEIDELTGSLKMDCSYLGNFEIGRLANTFTLVDIDGKFGSYEINTAPELSADIDAKFSFADLKYNSDIDIDFHYRVKESNKSHYKGKIGAGNPNKIIRIDSSYGNLRLRKY